VNLKSHIPHVIYITNHKINVCFKFKHVLLPILGMDGFGRCATSKHYSAVCHEHNFIINKTEDARGETTNINSGLDTKGEAKKRTS
jgi:hypothetical protein